jgi:hypothetical protein
MRKKCIKKGGEVNKCAEAKPICIKKNNKNQTILCSENNLEKEADNIKLMEHAYNVFSGVAAADEDDGSCTTFDYVWLQNIGEAKRKALDAQKQIDSLEVTRLSPTQKEEIIKILQDNPIKFASNFFAKYIEIATKKWDCNNEEPCTRNVQIIIEKLQETHSHIDELVNNPELNKIMSNLIEKLKASGESQEETIEEKFNRQKASYSVNLIVKDNLLMISDIFDIGLYVLYDKQNLDNFTIKDIIEKLNKLNNLFKQPSGGKKLITKKYMLKKLRTKKYMLKKLRTKKYMLKKLRTKKYSKNKRGGAFFGGFFGVVFTVIGIVLLSAGTFGVGGALLGVGLLILYITGKMEQTEANKGH